MEDYMDDPDERRELEWLDWLNSLTEEQQEQYFAQANEQLISNLIKTRR